MLPDASRRACEFGGVLRIGGRERWPARPVTRLLVPDYAPRGYAARLRALLADNQRGAALSLLRAVERSQLSGVQPPDAAFFGTLAERAEMDLAESDEDVEVVERGAAVQFVDLSTEEAEARAMAEVAAATTASARPPVKLEV